MRIRSDTSVREFLFSNREEGYKSFQCSLMPTVDKDRVIGVRVPLIRAFVKDFKDSSRSREFLSELPHKFFEEDMIHALLINSIKDYDGCINLLREFLPYVDNWACCDVFAPVAISKNKERALVDIYSFIESAHTYTCRFGICMLMKFYLDSEFDTSYLHKVASVKSEDYYVKMMQAWYFATALAKQYESTVRYLEQKALDVWTHNKTIQKALESYRIDAKKKEYLKSLKIKRSANRN